MDQQIGGALGIAIIAAVYLFGAKLGFFVPSLSSAFSVTGVIALLPAVIAVIGLKNPGKKVSILATASTGDPDFAEVSAG